MLLDRTRYDRWAELGSQDTFARANECARQILAEHQIPPLPEAAEEVIAQVLKAREARNEQGSVSSE